VNILNKQSRTIDKGGPLAWGLGVGLTTPHSRKVIRCNMFQSSSDLD
jgi:hypothetical protein